MDVIRRTCIMFLPCIKTAREDYVIAESSDSEEDPFTNKSCKRNNLKESIKWFPPLPKHLIQVPS